MGSSKRREDPAVYASTVLLNHDITSSAPDNGITAIREMLSNSFLRHNLEI